MKLSLDWLSDYVKIKLSAEKLAERFTLTGSEVETIEVLKPVDPHIVVGEIKTIIKHPHADRLQVAKVDIGTGQLMDIVCGAPNIKPGQKVPVAQVGSTLPNGTVIEKAAIRGFQSHGMLCADEELGFGTDHSGILILDPDLKVGLPLNRALGLNDTVFHFALTPNRPDCFSVIGLAREAAAFIKAPLTLPSFTVKEQGSAITKHVRVTVREPKLCPRYTARYCTHVSIGPSPLWLKSRLTKAGVSSINNVVDITNYVMLETGQPLHAFDASLVANQSIIVRRARAGERVVTLDGEQRILKPSLLVIADAKKVLAIAGVIGGQSSAISEKTTTVILESAIFDPLSVRLTSQKLGVKTESAVRFERGVDPEMTTAALDRAAKLIAELAGGTVSSGRIDTRKIKPAARAIKISADQVNGLLGASLTVSHMNQLLKHLGFSTASTTTDLAVTVPSWRQDVTIAEDVIEEIGRLHGYNRLKPTRLKVTAKPVGLPPARQAERQLKDWLVGKGLTGVMTYAYYGEPERATVGGDQPHLRLANPLNQDQAYLRRSLIPSLLTVLSRQADDFVGVFEIGTVFSPNRGTLPEERRAVTLGYRVREGAPALLPENRLQYRWLKSVAESMVDAFHLPAVSYKTEPRPGWLVRVEMRTGQALIGTLQITRLPKQPKRLYAFIELDFDRLLQYQQKPIMRQSSAFPAVERDIACWVAHATAWSAVSAAVQACSELIRSIELFDLYADASHSGKRSLAMRLRLQASDRTLKEKEIEETLRAVKETLRQKFSAAVRD